MLFHVYSILRLQEVELHDSASPTLDNASCAMERLRAAVRTENRAAGQRLTVIGELDVLWLRQVGERSNARV
jgi:hypothetical protein